MKELHDFDFTNHIVVRNHAIPVNVYVSTPDGVSYLEVRISNEVICDLTDGSICNRIQNLYKLIYPRIEQMGYSCDIDLTNDETIEVEDACLIFNFHGCRALQ